MAVGLLLQAQLTILKAKMRGHKGPKRPTIGGKGSKYKEPEHPRDAQGHWKDKPVDKLTPEELKGELNRLWTENNSSPAGLDGPKSLRFKALRAEQNKRNPAPPPAAPKSSSAMTDREIKSEMQVLERHVGYGGKDPDKWKRYQELQNEQGKRTAAAAKQPKTESKPAASTHEMRVPVVGTSHVYDSKVGTMRVYGNKDGSFHGVVDDDNSVEGFESKGFDFHAKDATELRTKLKGWKAMFAGYEKD